MPAASPPAVPLTADRVPDAVLALMRAFQDDAVARYVLLRAPTDFPRSLATFYACVLRYQYGPRGGLASLCLVMPDGRGAALWQRDAGHASSGPRAGIGPIQQLRLLPHLGSLCGWGPRAIARLVRLATVVDAAHARVCGGRAHFYLGILGVDPVCQGRSYATRLLAPVLARADAEGTLCHLESSKAANVPIYERFGFKLVEVVGAWEGRLSDADAAAAARDGSGRGRVVDASGAPLLWVMRRDPAAPAAADGAPHDGDGRGCRYERERGVLAAPPAAPPAAADGSP